jgi:hypothetical protein
VTVEDRVTFSKPQTFGTALVTFNRVFRRGDDTFVVYDAAGSVVVDVEVDGGAWTYSGETIENPNRPTPIRLGFNLDAPVESARVRFTIRPAAPAEDLPGVYHAPEVGPGFQPREADAVIIQAEDIAEQSGGEVTICEKPGAVGKAFKFWDDDGHALTWKATVPREGDYALRIRYCHAGTDIVSRQVEVDGRPIGRPDATFVIPGTGGWSSAEDDWNTVWLAQGGKATIVHLTAGEHAITMVNDCGTGVNLDWIELVPINQ